MKNRVLSILMMMFLGAILFIFTSCGDGGANNPAENPYVNQSTAGFVEAFYPTEESAKSSKFTPDSLYINGVLTQGSENYKATNQQWVEAGITGEFSSYPESDRSYPSSLSALSAKANLDEKNNTLLNTILFNNQKVYG